MQTVLLVLGKQHRRTHCKYIISTESSSYIIFKVETVNQDGATVVVGSATARLDG